MKPKTKNKKVLINCCGAHAIQDGLGAALYVILPILAQTFGLSLTQIGTLRALNSFSMVSFEILSGLLAERLGERNLIAFGLICAGFGYLGVSLAPTHLTVAICFFIIGLGAAFQHALSSSLISQTYPIKGVRSALGIFNSAGDIGKLMFTALFSFGLGIGISWQRITGTFGIITLIGAALIFLSLFLLSSGESKQNQNSTPNKTEDLGWGLKNNRLSFASLSFAVFLDTAVQSTFLTFVAFITIEKGVPISIATFGVTLVLIGGVAGKAVSGIFAEKLGVRTTFVTIQLLTAFGMLAIPLTEKFTTFILLPFIGIVLQGSTSITYSMVNDIVHPRKLSRGFSLIYTVSSFSGLVGPIAFGLISDYFAINIALVVMAVMCITSIPPILMLRKG